MGQKVASLEIELGMATGTAVAELNRFGGTVDAVSAQAIRDLDRIDASMKNVGGLDAATASAVRFAEETARSALQMARDAERSERNGERIVGQLERQIAVYGLTRAEVRALRAEEAARAAEANNQHELATRIRTAEAALADKEWAAARRARQEAESAAEDAFYASEKAARAKEKEAQAVREAAHAYQMFEARVRAGAVAMREEEAAARAASAAIEQQERRTAALGAAMFEAHAKRKMGEYRDEQAAQAAADAERTAAALRSEAAAADMAAREHAALAAAVQGSHAAQMADAEAAERLRMATDPLYAATARLNAEIAESTRLYHAGATAPAEYARQQEVLAARLRAVGQAQQDAQQMMHRGAGTLTQLSFQINDVATMAAMGAPPMQIFASQAGQIFQIAQMAEGGVKGFAAQIGRLAVAFAPLAIVVAGAGVALYQWHQQIEKDAGMKAYVQTLGLTQKEMKKLGDQSVTAGDMLKGFWRAINEGEGKGPSLMSRLFTDQDKKVLQGLLDFTLQVFKGIAAATYGLLVGSYRAGIAIWEQFPAALGDIFIRAVNASASAIEFLVNKGIDAVNAIARGANEVIGREIFGQVAQVQIDRMQNPFKGAASKLGSDIYEAFDGAAAEGLKGIYRIIARTGQFAVESAQERARKKAQEIIADRTPKTDKHAEQLARDAAAMEAQIRNLYRLADAYDVSGAAALIAEARVKAESKAIKQRADIEAAVAREVRLSIAERVVDAAKSTANMRDQATAQATVNTLVAAGLVPAERAAELVKDQIADLPLLAALQAAQHIGDTKGIEAATAALMRQRAARIGLRGEEAAAALSLDNRAVENQLALLGAELRLIGATDAARAHELATIKATQEAKAKYQNPAQQAEYVRGQVAVADATALNRQATDAWNDALGYTADIFDEIDRSAQSAASGMADAFGKVGAAIGDAFTIMTGYYAEQTSLQQAHEAALRKAGTNQAAIDHEQRLFALRSSSLQIGAYGDMAAAAKGFFKEGSDGYRAMAAAEKVYRIAQLAMSVQAMVQNAAETLGFVTNAAARATADGTAGIAAQSKLPFPFNIAAMAATGAALVAAGVAVLGGFGGGSKNTLPESNAGKGTVLGDPDAQSESLRRGIDALKEVDLMMLTASREMARHLRSIDSQIGGFAAQIVRSGDVNANGGITEGFKPDLIGSYFKTFVPIIGGFLSSLFGSKTTVVGSGLYGGAQTVGDIVNGGFDASTYSDVEKKKKFFGITTGKSYSTQYGQADPNLENQFTLILRGFASAIGAAAGPLGEATETVQARLNRFVVNIGKVDLQGLTGAQIEEKLEAIFGAAADGMADAAFPGLSRFQKAGEGLFETLVRVSSTVEAVDASFAMLGRGGIGIDASVALAEQFDSLSALTSAQQTYFEGYYTEAEQAAARTAQMTRAITSLGLSMPSSLAGFRALVEAQDLATEAGRATYATLIQLAPAFADLQSVMGSAKSTADIAAERQGLERKLLEISGDEAAIRALDLAKLDVSNRALQQQVWAAEAARDAAKAAEDLRKAWSSVGDGIMDEVKRIRGIGDAQGPAGFAAIMGQFNAVTTAARAGDMDAAKQLPALSRSLLDAAAKAATSRQELDRVQAEAATSLEATYAAIAGFGTADTAEDSAARTAEAMATAATAATNAVSATAGLVTEIRALREEVTALRTENAAGHDRTANEAGRSGKVLERAQNSTGGVALATRAVG